MTNRVEHDHYPTPHWMTQSLIRYADIQGSVLECCSGEDKAIAKLLMDDHEVHTNDLFFEADSQLDATIDRAWQKFPSTDWVITNPPFTGYFPILKHAHLHARIGVAMLLRVTADEMVMVNKDRYDWWDNHTESLSIKMPRYCFSKSSKTGKFGTDSAYCQWFVWRKDDHRYPRSVIRLPHDQISGFTKKPEI